MKKATALLIALLMMVMSFAVQAAPSAEQRGNAFGKNGIRPGGPEFLTPTDAMELRTAMLEEKKQQKLDARESYTEEEIAHFEDAAASILEDAPEAFILEPGSIKMRGKVVKFDTPPVIKAGRTLIPVRAISEGLGATVDYVNESGVQTVTITKETTKTVVAEDGTEQTTTVTFIVVMELGNKIVTIIENDVKRIVDLQDVTPGAVNGRTYVPLRFLAELFGLKTTYEGETQTIDIEEEGEVPAEEVISEDETASTDEATAEETPLEEDPLDQDATE